jgi:phage/plasmid-like protein (TIGR03299 family)
MRARYRAIPPFSLKGKTTMAHQIDMSNGRANIAFMGDRKDIWHSLGHEMLPGQSIEQWAHKAGLDWTAHKADAWVDLRGPEFAQVDNGGMVPVPGESFVVRDDTGAVLGRATDTYQIVQPSEVLQWFDRYITVDDRFHLDVAGSLKGGRIIWATATFNGDMEVGGSAHRARLLMSTSLDQTMSTINKATMTRVICNNTLSAALADSRAEIRTRHNTKFDAAAVGKELAALARGFTEFKAIGDAMALSQMTNADTSAFFKGVLGIPFDAKKDDISTRMFNQYEKLSEAYVATVNEGTEAGTQWAALNAVTRYVDHERGTKNATDETRFTSAQFGSGEVMKAKAWNLLQNMERTLAASVSEPVSVPVDLSKLEARLLQN